MHFGKELRNQVGLPFDACVADVDVAHPAVGCFVHLFAVGVNPCSVPEFRFTSDGGHHDVEGVAFAFKGGFNAKANRAHQCGPRASI